MTKFFLPAKLKQSMYGKSNNLDEYYRKKEKSIFDNIITCLIARGIFFDLCRDSRQIEKMK